MVAQVTFRSDNIFTDRFGRDLADRARLGDTFGLWQQFEVERYLEHHGTKLVRRFDANSYLVIGKAMDLHDVARGRGHLAGAMARITAADDGHRHLVRSALPQLPAAPDRRDPALRRAVRAATWRSTHRTATTPS